MSISSTLKSITASTFKQIHTFGKNPKQSFILLQGHMRSGSSLLSHLLISHPTILGIGERNLPYSNENDLWKLVARCRWEWKKPFQKYDYFIDQINHNHCLPDISLLKNKQIKSIFLVRKPAASISSLLRLSEQFYDGKWTPETATTYYTNRLQYLLRSKQVLNTEILLIKYEKLTKKPEKELARIQTFLQAKIPFQSDYQTFDFTGKRGDPSESIQAGKITKSDKRLIEINPTLLEKANQAYLELVNSFS